MVIEFKKQSLFERFGILATNKADLMRQFQSQPELRKNLPLYIKTINDEKQLYAEELFTATVDGAPYTVKNYLDDLKRAEIEIQTRYKYAALVDTVRNFGGSVGKIKLSGKIFDELIQNALNESNADTFKFHRADQSGEVYRAFLESLWKELENAIKSIVNEMDIKNTNSLHRVLNGVSDKSLHERFLRVFSDASATLIDTLVTRMDDEALFEQGLEFISGLGSAIFKDKIFYTSYKFFASRLTEAANEHGFLINKNFSKIVVHLKMEDAKKLCACLEAVMLGFLSVDNADKKPYEKLAEAAPIAQSNLQYINDNALESEHKGIISSFVAVMEQGETWFDNFKSFISTVKNKNNLSNSLFELCRMIALVITKKEDRIVFYNMIAEASGFQSELMRMITQKERLEKVVEDIRSQRKYMLYSKIKEQIGSEIPTPQVVDQFILDYYALTILDPDTKKFYNVMKQVCFTSFALIENVPEQSFNFGYGGLTPKGEFMKDLFMEMPNDWEIEGAGFTIKSFLSSKLSIYSGSRYGDSKSKAHIDKCDKATTVVKKTTTTSQSTAGSTLGGWKSASQTQAGKISNSTSSQSEDYRVPAFGWISALCALIMIIGFAAGNPALGVAFLILAGTCLVVYAVGKKIVDTKYAIPIQNGRALAAIILIPIFLICVTVIPIANSRSNSSVSGNGAYTVTLNKQSGTGGTNSIKVDYGNAMPYATAPTRSGYTFGGYYTSTNGGGTQYYTASMTSARTYNLSTNTTLYAKWTQDGITLTPSNFLTYFNLSSSCSIRTSSIGYTTYYYADYTYSITPKSTVNQFLSSNPSSISVTIGLDISSISTSYGTPSEYKIYVTLYKSSGYKASGSQSYSISSIDKYWKDGIYSVNGTIYN